MAKTIKPIPRINPWISNNTSRGAPEMVSNPTVASTRPKHIEKMVLGISSPPRPTNVAKANNISAKISGGPKFRATDARSGANRVKKTVATVPPTKDARAAVTKARLALPCNANGRPSNVVATAVEAPGIPSVTDDIAPPYMAP